MDRYFKPQDSSIKILKDTVVSEKFSEPVKYGWGGQELLPALQEPWGVQYGRENIQGQTEAVES